MPEDLNYSSWHKHYIDILKCELMLFRKVPLLIAAAIILILIPTFYTATYVCSVWDPYENMKNLPVGLVTLDRGIDIQGKTYNLGNDLIKELNKQKPFDFLDYPDEKQSIAAVRSGKIYFALVVPADFSAKAVPGIDVGRLKMYTSSGRCYVAMQMAKGMAQKVVDAVNVRIATERWKAVLASAQKGRDAAIKLREGSEKALLGSRKMEQGLGKIDTRRLVSAGKDLHENTTKLASGLAKSELLDLIIGVPPQDLKKLANGAEEYQQKIVELADGIDRLHKGSENLTHGLDQIRKGLIEFAQAIVVGEETPDSLAVSVASDQIELVPASTNGAAFAPYFMGLSLWIGVLAVGFLFREIVFPLSLKPKRRIAKILGKWTAPFLISSIAAAILGLFIHFVLQVPIEDEIGYYVILFTAVLTFNAIILSLNSLIGDAGKLLALIFLIIQISSVGGAYPLSTEPTVYQAISPYIPMTHVVFGLRAAMFGSFNGNWLINALAMLPWLFISLGLSLIAARRFKYVPDDQYGPALDLSFMTQKK